MLGQESLAGERLAPRCPELLKALQHWRGNPTLRPPNLKATPGGPTLQPSFAALQHGNKLDTLVFLEDISQIAQKAQQLKLASARLVNSASRAPESVPANRRGVSP